MGYYYTQDHLGSIREMTDGNDAIQARYDYDPYGRTTLVSGTNLSDKQYAGMYMHQPSGLNMTWFRAYDANAGRWLSRDPIAENGGINLYGYVGNEPVNAVDRLGLDYNNVDDPNYQMDDYLHYGGPRPANLPPNTPASDNYPRSAVCPCGQHLEWVPSIFKQTRADMGVNDATTIAAGAGFVGAARLGAGALSPAAKVAAGYVAAVNLGAAAGAFRCMPN